MNTIRIPDQNKNVLLALGVAVCIIAIVTFSNGEKAGQKQAIPQNQQIVLKPIEKTTSENAEHKMEKLHKYNMISAFLRKAYARKSDNESDVSVRKEIGVSDFVLQIKEILY